MPVLRGGATLGVLVVQNRARRTYSEEEIEALQTTAMLLAEMIASGELQSIAGQRVGDRGAAAASLKGQPIAEGLGLGHVVLHQPRIVVAKIVADDSRRELGRLDDGDRGDARLGRRADRPQRRRRARASIATCSRRSA